MKALLGLMLLSIQSSMILSAFRTADDLLTRLESQPHFPNATAVDWALARSGVRGPYVGCPRNPILTHRHLGQNHPVTNAGHADLVQTAAVSPNAALVCWFVGGEKRFKNRVLSRATGGWWRWLAAPWRTRTRARLCTT